MNSKSILKISQSYSEDRFENFPGDANINLIPIISIVECMVREVKLVWGILCEVLNYYLNLSVLQETVKMTFWTDLPNPIWNETNNSNFYRQ
jgi:hypothetical protein